MAPLNDYHQNNTAVNNTFDPSHNLLFYSRFWIVNHLFITQCNAIAIPLLESRDRQTERHRDRQRETERHRDRQRDRQRERQRDTETDRERDRERQTDRQRDRQRAREALSGKSSS